MAGWDIADGYRAASSLLDVPEAERPTAVFAVTDRAATGVLLAAANLGLAVPREVSVIGFDDQESLADTLVPALTTVALPHTGMGELAVSLAVGAASPRPGGGRPAPVPATPRHARHVLPCDVVVRSSTAAPSRP